MDNLFAYLKWRGDLSFSKCKINELDFALFSQLVIIPYLQYINMPMSKTSDSITIEELAKLVNDNKEKFIKKIGLIIPYQIIDLLIIMGKSNRYKHLLISNYEHNVSINIETQFAAFCIDLDASTRIIVYSGTDDTIIGWKENFNMIITSPTEAQKVATKYLKKYSEDKKVYITGHSKGGNLAIYSTLHIREDVFNRIIRVYAFDGPGISEDIKLNDDEKQRFKKIYNFVPQTSVIGRLFYHYENEIVVKSTNLGLYQHDILSWEININHFEKLQARDSDSLYIEQKINKVLESMSPIQREEFVEIGYGLFMRTKSETLTELNNNKAKLIKQYLNVNKTDRKIIDTTLSELLVDKIFVKNIYYVIKEMFEKGKEKKKYIKSNEQKNKKIMK